jgi:ClpP class serine protease|tara:strand:+ start:33 stop:791 length:759 start_codon:yes stop_codon:yes gene_type:complete
MIDIIIIFLVIIFYSAKKRNEIMNNYRNNDKQINIADLDNIIIISDTNINIKNIVDIDSENSFMKAYSKFNINDILNIVLYCEGSNVSSSDAIINILLMHEGLINIYIPRYCYSGGSMIALCGDNIYMNNYSLLSPVDPQISFDDQDEEENLTSCKYYLNLKRVKGLKGMSEKNALRYYECKHLYDDNLRNMDKILEDRYNLNTIKKIKKNFGHGIFPHAKQFNIDELENMGIDISIPVPLKIERIFRRYFN